MFSFHSSSGFPERAGVPGAARIDFPHKAFCQGCKLQVDLLGSLAGLVLVHLGEPHEVEQGLLGGALAVVVHLREVVVVVVVHLREVNLQQLAQLAQNAIAPIKIYFDFH